jgi:hypothetical protein
MRLPEKPETLRDKNLWNGKGSGLANKPHLVALGVLVFIECGPAAWLETIGTSQHGWEVSVI